MRARTIAVQIAVKRLSFPNRFGLFLSAPKVEVDSLHAQAHYQRNPRDAV